MMDIFVTVPLMTVAVLITPFGVIAIRTGWMLPWPRAKTPRPRLWGYSSLLGVVGMCGIYFGYRVDELVLFAVAVFAFTGSGVPNLLADRPGGVRRAPPPIA